MYGVLVDENGKLSSAESGIRHDWAGTTWQDTVLEKRWSGMKVNILHHEGILWLKKHTANQLGESLREKDLHDMKLFGES